MLPRALTAAMADSVHRKNAGGAVYGIVESSGRMRVRHVRITWVGIRSSRTRVTPPTSLYVIRIVSRWSGGAPTVLDGSATPNLSSSHLCRSDGKRTNVRD